MLRPSESNIPAVSSASQNTIIDFISGQSVSATREELEAVQVFSKILVDDYGYPKTHIRTAPPIASQGTAL